MRRGGLQFTLLFLALALGTIIAVFTWLAWPLLAQFTPLLSEITLLERIILCLGIPLRTLWGVLNPIMIIREKSEWLAASLVIQSLVNLLIIATCLYYFETGRVALFWGQLFGLAACLVVPFVIFGSSILGPIQLEWIRHVRGVALGAWVAGMVDNLRNTVESAFIAKYGTSTTLGNYNHARVYQGLLTQGTNAFANVLWPIALKEAEEPLGTFPRIRPVWDLAYAGITCLGIGAVFLGQDLVDLLTHNKFEQAGIWLPWLVLYVLLQNAGKPATAILYNRKKGNEYSSIRITSQLLMIVGLIIWVPEYGVTAVLSIMIAEMILVRVLIALRARQARPTPFQDHWIVGGCLLIVGVWWADGLLSFRLVTEIGLVLVVSILIMGLLAYQYRKSLMEMWKSR